MDVKTKIPNLIIVGFKYNYLHVLQLMYGGRNPPLYKTFAPRSLQDDLLHDITVAKTIIATTFRNSDFTICMNEYRLSELSCRPTHRIVVST